VFIAQKQMGVADMMNKVNQIQSRFGSAKQSFIAVSTEAVQVAEDQFLTKMIQFFGDAESRVDKLQRLCAKVVTQYQELTKYFMCSERYDVKNSNEFFAIWTTFVDSLSKYLSSAQE
jgi:transcription elongation factor GreA-like protein